MEGAAAVWAGVVAGADEACAVIGSDAAALDDVLLLLLLPRGFSPAFLFDNVSAEIGDSFALLPESRLWLMLEAASFDDDGEGCANTSAGRAAARSMRSRQTPPILI